MALIGRMPLALSSPCAVHPPPGLSETPGVEPMPDRNSSIRGHAGAVQRLPPDAGRSAIWHGYDLTAPPPPPQLADQQCAATDRAPLRRPASRSTAAFAFTTPRSACGRRWRGGQRLPPGLNTLLRWPSSSPGIGSLSAGGGGFAGTPPRAAAAGCAADQAPVSSVGITARSHGAGLSGSGLHLAL